MLFKFEFRGKSIKHDQKVIKFHSFVFTADGKEEILYQAVKKGFVEHSHGSVEYYSNFPVLKIFSSTSGFGIRKAYQNYFFKLDESSNRQVRIKPLGYEHLYEDLYFQANGHFLTPDEIAELLGTESQTFTFYKRQTYLSKRELQEHIEVNYLDAAGKVAKVRHIRF